ncbi:MAG: discoidin domain-containing protein [Planctomycetota bacterium]|jgi:hypothetical protein
MFRQYLAWVVLLAGVSSICSAAVVPIDSITTDNPPGSPPYNIESVTVGGYTVQADRLATGTTTFGTIGGTEAPENDDFDINTALNWNLGATPWFTVNFGGGLWQDSNGDAPDFLLFESGGNAGDQPTFQAVFPDESFGQGVQFPSSWGPTGYNRDAAVANDAVDMNGQQLHGLAFSITDLLDANGDPLPADTVILGLKFERGGTDLVSLFAVIPPAVQARDPIPADGATDVVRDIVLGWTPGPVAVSHNVYFGTSWDDVNDASIANPLGVLVAEAQDANSYVPGERLDLGQTYFWRVDEVNNASPDSPWKGRVWSFTAEPFAYPIEGIVATSNGSSDAGAGPENAVNGSGLNVNDEHSIEATDMWLATPGADPLWIQYEFDRVYKLHEMMVWNYNVMFELMLGFGLKDVTVEYSTDGVDWVALEDVVFAQATATASYTANTTVDFGGAAAKFVRFNVHSGYGPMGQFGLSEVRFLQIPTFPREPQPADGETDVAPATALSWRAGREAALHEVYLGADPDGLALLDSVTEPTLTPDGLEYASRYSWKVVEVNDAEVPSAWESAIWTFVTEEYGVVEDFEGYDDDENPIFDTWLDGFVNDTGSTVGYFEAPFAEQNIVHGGSQSMPLFYENASSSAVSEATREFDGSQDWTRAGVQTLVLHFFGDADNTGGQLYIMIDNEKVPFDGAADALRRPWWTQWNVDLSAVTTNLRNVRSLTIGIEGSGAGVVYVDDILLYREAPSVAEEELWIEAEAAGTLGALWTTADDQAASGGQYVGSEDGDGDDNSDPPGADWHATYSFTVAGGTYKVVARIITAPGNSFWVRIADATSPQITRADGWINTNPMDGGDTWHWDEIHNDEQDDNVVHFTLSAGDHTLEIAKREDGTLLDAIVITDKLD